MRSHICIAPYSRENWVDDTLYRSQLSSRIEAQANNLAADLLMPWHLLVPVVEKKGIPELASMFEVSEQAMEIRLELGAHFASGRAMVAKKKVS